MANTVTMDEIAARAGVSRGAVSLALRRSPKISAKTTEHIFNVARELGYRPNLNASRLAQKDFSTFGLLVSDLHNPIMADILDGFVLTDQTGGYETYLASGFNSPDRERTVIESFLSHRVKGIVLMGSLLPESEIRDLARFVPVVAVGRRIAGLDCVLVDDAVGGRLASEHLCALGHRSLAHIDGGSGAGARLRRTAFLDCAGAIPKASVTVIEGNYTQECGYKGALSLFSASGPPTAIFAANDLTALGVLGAARERGLDAGKDYALVGFDDIALAAYDYVSLTTVSYSRTDMGRIAREMMQRRCQTPEAPFETVELQPLLVVRNTSGMKIPT